MNYLLKTFEFLKKNPFILIGFIILDTSSNLFEMVEYLNIGNKTILFFVSIIVGILSFYFRIGWYSFAWKRINGKREYVKNILSDSKYFFGIYLKQIVVIGLPMLLFPYLIPSYLYKIYFYESTLPVEYAKQLDANLVRLIPIFFCSLFFIYVESCIFVLKLKSVTKVLKISVDLFLTNIVNSLPVIFTMALALILNVSIKQIAVQYDYSSAMYWYITWIRAIIMSSINLGVFLIASQIFKKLYADTLDAQNKDLSQKISDGEN